MKLSRIAIVIFLLAVVIRIFFNFSCSLIPGVNGGYYPLQVRFLLTEGRLAFTDMPLLFSLQATIVRLVSWFGVTVTDDVILLVLKLFDSISLPFLLIPLYGIVRRMNIPLWPAAAILLYSMLSFPSLILIGDLQKNSLAIVFLFGALHALLKYFSERRLIDLILVLVFTLLMGLTHFGTTVFALLIIGLMVLFRQRWRDVALLVAGSGLVLILLWAIDPVRVHRLFTVVQWMFSRPAILGGPLPPPIAMMMVFSWILAMVGAIVLFRKKRFIREDQRPVMAAGIIGLLCCSFPLLEMELFKRLILFLFIPQILLIATLVPYLSVRMAKLMTILLVAMGILSLLAMLGRPKRAVITPEAFADLYHLKPQIGGERESLVIARHGLEWWAGWVLQTSIGQEKALDSQAYRKYRRIVILIQKSGFERDGQPDYFPEPCVPVGFEKFYTSEYFEGFYLTPQPFTNSE